MSDDARSYEEIPYPVLSFALTHPRALHAIAHLFGLESPPIDRCHVLEIGCAGGGNIVPIAYSLPEASFTTRVPAVRSALSRLSERFPGCVAVEELLTIGAAAEIFPALMYCWCSGRIRLYGEPPPLVRQPGDHPRASGICRYLVGQKRAAINLRQDTVNLSLDAARLAGLLDGTRARSDLPRDSGMSIDLVERALRELASAGVLEA